MSGTQCQPSVQSRSTLAAQPAMHQRAQPRAFTARQDDRPELIRCAVWTHDFRPP